MEQLEEQREKRTTLPPPSERNPSLPMDSNLQGGKACLVLRFLHKSRPGSDRKTDVQWTMLEPDPSLSSNTRKRIEKIKEAIEVLVQAKAVAPKLQENLDAEIMRKEVEIQESRSCLLKEVVFSTTEQMGNFKKTAEKLKVEVDEKEAEIRAVQRKQKELQLKVKEKELEIAAIQRKQEEVMGSLAKEYVDVLTNKEEQILDLRIKRDEAEVMIESLEKQLTEKCKANEALEMSVRRLACELKEKDLETARKLGEKDQLMELARKKHEADKLKSEEAHKLECDALKLKVGRAEGLFASYLSFFLNRFRTGFETALDETKSMSFQISETHLRSTENTRLATGGQNQDNTQLETAPPHTGDVIQTPTNLEKQKVERKRLRDVGQNLAPTDHVKLQGNKEIASEQKARKCARIILD